MKSANKSEVIWSIGPCNEDSGRRSKSMTDGGQKVRMDSREGGVKYHRKPNLDPYLIKTLPASKSGL